MADTKLMFLIVEKNHVLIKKVKNLSNRQIIITKSVNIINFRKGIFNVLTAKKTKTKKKYKRHKNTRKTIKNPTYAPVRAIKKSNKVFSYQKSNKKNEIEE